MSNTSAEQQSRKRKRKHTSKPVEDSPVAVTADDKSKVKAVKKAKKEHKKHNGDVDEKTAAARDEDVSAEEDLNEELRATALETDAADVNEEAAQVSDDAAEDEAVEEELDGKAGNVDIGEPSDLPSALGVSLPGEEQAKKRFDELGLSEKTLKAIQEMGKSERLYNHHRHS